MEPLVRACLRARVFVANGREQLPWIRPWVVDDFALDVERHRRPMSQIVSRPMRQRRGIWIAGMSESYVRRAHLFRELVRFGSGAG